MMPRQASQLWYFVLTGATKGSVSPLPSMSAMLSRSWTFCSSSETLRPVICAVATTGWLSATGQKCRVDERWLQPACTARHRAACERIRNLNHEEGALGQNKLKSGRR